MFKMPWLNQLASVTLTYKLILLFALGVVWYYIKMPLGVLGLYIPLVLLCGNLLLALIVHPRLSKNVSLMLLHIALLAFLCLLVLGQLTQLSGRFELSEGEAFTGQFIESERGLLHQDRLSGIRFVNQGVSVSYHPGVSRGETRNLVTWFDKSDQPHTSFVGDQFPLIINGYRFYTTFNKGFSPTFIWVPKQNGKPIVGTVHLPAYPIHEYEQARSLQLPDAKARIWVMLVAQQEILNTTHTFELTPPEKHYLVLRIGDERYELREGETISVAGGTLQYTGLRMWMGYKLYYDWTRPWLLAVILIMVLSMGGYFYKIFTAESWHSEKEKVE